MKAGMAATGALLALLAQAGVQRPNEVSPARLIAGAVPPLLVQSLYGRDLYAFYCASCHGRDGRGGGPDAPALRVDPPDLTKLTLRNGAMFPRARVEAIVDGRIDPPIGAHGSREMPVWGPIFSGLDANQPVNHERIRNIVSYLETLQVRYAMRTARDDVRGDFP